MPLPEYSFYCGVCGATIEAERYSEAKCPCCGQRYEYDEGVSISLSPEQKTVLRNHWLDSKRK